MIRGKIWRDGNRDHGFAWKMRKRFRVADLHHIAALEFGLSTWRGFAALAYKTVNLAAADQKGLLIYHVSPTSTSSRFQQLCVSTG